MKRNQVYKELEDKIGYHFRDRSLLVRAITHSSYANEKRMDKLDSNERLEFLGDAVLEVVSSEFLYETYPQLPEGELTRKRASMVCEPSLAISAREMNLGSYLRMGKGEDMTGGRERDSITSDAVEAVIGAIYLDGGLANAKEFIMNHVLNDIEHKALFYDSKTILQEIVQGRKMEEPKYRLIKSIGPDHNKSFVVEVVVGDQVYGPCQGHTKKSAEQAAAYEAVLNLKDRQAGDSCI
jgi:ribonuclease-3